MDTDRFADRILEVENLTDNLEDNEANILIDWGINQLPPLVGNLEDEEAASDKVNALMQFMRGINSLVGNLADVSAEGLKDLAERYAQVFGDARQANQAERETAAASIANMQPQDAVRFLLQWVLPLPPNENTPPTDSDKDGPSGPDDNTLNKPNDTESPPSTNNWFRPSKAV